MEKSAHKHTYWTGTCVRTSSVMAKLSRQMLFLVDHTGTNENVTGKPSSKGRDDAYNGYAKVDLWIMLSEIMLNKMFESCYVHIHNGSKRTERIILCSIYISDNREMTWLRHIYVLSRGTKEVMKKDRSNGPKQQDRGKEKTCGVAYQGSRKGSKRRKYNVEDKLVKKKPRHLCQFSQKRSTCNHPTEGYTSGWVNYTVYKYKYLKWWSWLFCEFQGYQT